MRDDHRAVRQRRPRGTYCATCTCAGCGPNSAGSISVPTVTITSRPTSRRPPSTRPKRSPASTLNTVPSVKNTAPWSDAIQPGAPAASSDTRSGGAPAGSGNAGSRRLGGKGESTSGASAPVGRPCSARRASIASPTSGASSTRRSRSRSPSRTAARAVRPRPCCRNRPRRRPAGPAATDGTGPGSPGPLARPVPKNLAQDCLPLHVHPLQRRALRRRPSGAREAGEPGRLDRRDQRGGECDVVTGRLRRAGDRHSGSKWPRPPTKVNSTRTHSEHYAIVYLLVNDPFKALAHPIRRGIVERLAGGPATVKDATGGFGVSKPAISKHLKVLEESGVVSRVIDGRTHRLSLDTPSARRGRRLDGSPAPPLGAPARRRRRVPQGGPDMNAPQVVSPEEWEAAWEQLLVKEKEYTRARRRSRRREAPDADDCGRARSTPSKAPTARRGSATSSTAAAS